MPLSVFLKAYQSRGHSSGIRMWPPILGKLHKHAR